MVEDSVNHFSNVFIAISNTDAVWASSPSVSHGRTPIPTRI